MIHRLEAVHEVESLLNVVHLLTIESDDGVAVLKPELVVDAARNNLKKLVARGQSIFEVR